MGPIQQLDSANGYLSDLESAPGADETDGTALVGFGNQPSFGRLSRSCFLNSEPEMAASDIELSLE